MNYENVDLSSLSLDQSLLEQINPVFNTAKMTLFQLAASGNKDAASISEKLGLTYEETQSNSSTEEFNLGAVIMEIRYRTMAAMAIESGYGTEVDLPCGYTPRAIEFARKGIRFKGLDLPAAIAEASPAITSLIDEDSRHLASFEGVDATNYSSLKKAFDDIDGEVCITTEGLMMYFTDSEAGEFCDNIRRILVEHGGCWITADPETALQYILIAKVVYADRFMEVMLRGKKRAEDRSDVQVSSRTMVIDPSNAGENMKKAMMFLSRHGLKAERLTVADYAPELASLKNFTSEQAEAIKRTLSQFAYWKITPIAGVSMDTTCAKADTFELKAELDEGKLLLRPIGRLDTLTSPGLLTFFENTVKDNATDEVIIDCEGLEYISSAGLRVLLIMSNECSGNLTAINIKKGVMEIIEQTGFDSVLNLDPVQG